MGLPSNILIAGYIGFGNTGDEAIAQAMTDQLREAIPGAEITIVSGDPAQTAAAYRVRAIAWRDLVAIRDAVQHTDLTIVGGGGLFHDYWGLDPDTALSTEHSGLSYLMTPALLSAIYRKPLMLYAVGVGPLQSEHGRRYTKVIADLATRITVRDAASRNWLETLGVAPDKITVTADPAFDLPAPPATGHIPEVREWLARRPAIAVCLRTWSFGVDQWFWERQVAAALDALLAEQGGQALFLPLQCASGPEDDVAVAERVRARLENQSAASVLARPLPPPELAGIIAQADLVLGMRLHSLIFSLAAGVPFVALEYDPKVSLLAGMAGSDALPLGGIEAGALLERMRQALAQSPAARDAARARAQDLRRLARQNAPVAAQLLRESSGAPPAPDDLLTILGRLISTQLSAHDALLRRVHAGDAQREVLHQQWVAERDALQKQWHAERDALQQQWHAERDTLQQHWDVERDTLQKELERAGLKMAEMSRQFEHTLVATTQAFEQRLAPLESKTFGGIVKRALQVVLDLVEICTPARLRTAVRKYYLNWFYFRLYPDRRPAATETPPRPPRSVRRALHGSLDTVQHLVPEPVRKAARPLYLPLYRRFFPRGPYEFAAPVPPPPPAAAAAPPPAPPHTPKVSVILPVWNHARLLGDAIASVLQQSYRNLELIVVDDGSDDDLLPVARQFADDPRLHFIRRPHQGLPRTLSAGFRFASGDLMTWTSADNLMKPAMLATLVNFLLRRPDVQMTYGDMQLIDDQGAPLAGSDYRVAAQRPGATHQLRLPRTVETLGLVNDNFIGGCFLYRSGVARVAGPFDDALLGTEDYDYWLRIQLLGRVEHVDSDDCLYEYRVHQDSLSGRHTPQIVRNANDLITQHKRRTAFYRLPFQVVIAIAAAAPPALENLARTLAAAFAQDGHTVTITDAPDTGPPDTPPGKTLAICFSPALAPELLARTAGPDPPFLFLWAPAPDCAIPQPHLTWILCESRRLTEQLPASVAQNWSLSIPPTFSFADQLLLNLKGRDRTGQALVYIGPLEESVVDWQAVSALVSACPERPFLFASTSPEHVFDPRPRLPAGQIYFLGYRPWDEWYGLLAQAALLLAPFHAVEGIEPDIQTTMLAYVAAAKPILATDAIRLAGFDDAPGTLIADPAAFADQAPQAMALPPDPAAADLYLQSRSPTAAAHEMIGIANTRLFFHQTRPAATVPGPPPEPSACLIETSSLDAGGLERVVADLACSLRDAGLPTAIAVTGHDGKIAEECRAAGISVHLTGHDPQRFEQILQNTGILIPHYSNFGSPLAWRAGIPVLSFLHNSYIWMDAAEDRAVRDTALFTTRYLAVSQAVKSYFCRKYSVDPQKVTCVPNGVNIQRLEEAARRTPRATRASLGLRPDDYVFLNVATLTGVKGQVHAICAVRALAERCPRLRLLLLKSQADAVYTHELTALVKEFGLADRILFCPSTDQISDYYRLADAFLLPSLTEGWSLAKTEAMFFGLPLILTEVGGADEVIENNDIGILVPPAFNDPLEISPANLRAIFMDRSPRNLPALIAAMEDFYQRPDYWRAKGQAGTAKVRARFDVTKIAAEHLRVIRTVLAQHQGL